MLDQAVAFLKNITGNTGIYFHKDSITGESKLLVSENNKLELITIEALYNKMKNKYKEIKRCDGKKIIIPKNIKIFSIKNGKVKLVNIKSLVKHRTDKKIFKVKSKIGEINVTEDHSLMTIKNCKFIPEIPEKIKFISSPLKYSFENMNMNIDVLDKNDIFNNLILKGNFDSKIYKKVAVRSNTSPIQLKKYGLPIWHLKREEILSIKNKVKTLRIRQKGPKIPTKINIDENLMTFFGLWIADGCICKGKKSERILISSYYDEECKKIIDKVAKKFKCKVYISDKGVTANLTSNIIFNLMMFLGFKGKALTKKVPNWVFGLKESLMAAFLRGYFSGDGTVSKGDINVSSISRGILEDIQTLLLFFNIRSYIRKDSSRSGYQTKHKHSWKLSINHTDYKKIFLKEIKFLQKNKNKKIKLAQKSQSFDIIPLEMEIKEKIRKRYSKNRNFSREYLKKLIKFQDKNIKDMLENVINLEVFFEKPIIENLGRRNINVYDIETETGNFIANNVVLKNSDGVCSAALIAAFLSQSGKKPKLFCGELDEKELAKFGKKGIENAIFVDLAIDQYPEFLTGFKGKKVLVIDHHPISNDLNKIGFLHINPRFENPDIYISAAQICHKICTRAGLAGFEWLARLGAVGDRSISGTKEEREAADLVDAIKIFKKEKGMISLAKFLAKSKKLEDFLYKPEYIGMGELLKAEIEKQIERFKIEKTDDINFFEVRSRYSITSIMATKIFDLYPDETIITYNKSGRFYKLSGRSRKYDIGAAFKKSSSGIGRGGGHKIAAGSMIREDGFSTFRRRLLQLLK